MLCLHDEMRTNRAYKKYHVDVEYNRYQNRIKRIIQNVDGESEEKVMKINCDLVIHSRGDAPEQENLIALEMKKSTGRNCDKTNDKYRLEALTASELHKKGIFAWAGRELQNERYHYELGIYCEVNQKKR